MADSEARKCSQCGAKLPLSAFASTGAKTRYLKTCLECRTKQRARDAKWSMPLQSLDTNAEHIPKRRRCSPPQPGPANPPPLLPRTPSEFILRINGAGEVNVSVDPPYGVDRTDIDMESTGNINIRLGNAPATVMARHLDASLNPVRANKPTIRAVKNTTSRPREFLRAGRNSQDNPETARRRQEIAAIQRKHRAQLREARYHNEVPNLSQTPPLYDIRPPLQPPLQHSPTQPSPLPIRPRSPYFACASCGILRGLSSAVSDEDPPICIYCVVPDEVELKYCKRGSHERPQTEFFNRRSQELATCQECLSSLAQVASQQSESSGPVRGRAELPDDVAVSPEHWKLIENFRKALRKERLDICSRCQERWFNLKLNVNSICERCRKSRDKEDKQPHLMSDGNEMDPGEVPTYLPQLSQVEEMLIARAHVHVEAKRIRGHQYQYTGHTVCFMNNTTKLYNTLPLLPHQLDVLLLQPANHSHNGPQFRKQFIKDFKVKRSNVVQWLQYLKRNSPAYRDVDIDFGIAQQLPDDGDLLDQVTTIVDGPRDDSGHVNAVPSVHPEHADVGIDLPPVSTVVPNLLVEQSERDILMLHLDAQRQHLTMPSLQVTPINESRSQLLFSMAYPTLFPRSKADFSLPRRRTVTLQQWSEHLIRYKDGRFGSHPRFRYMVFNQIMRDHVRKASNWLVKKSNLERELTVEDLREALEDTGQSLLLSKIMRHANMLAGTRPFWTNKRNQLMAYARNLDCKSLFFTFSAADMQWFDLQSHMPRFEDYLAGDDQLRKMIVRNNLQSQPHIAAGWLFRRFELFKQHLLKPLFNMIDYWHRYEWQARGSGHVHGFAWFKDALAADMSTPESRASFAGFWSQFVTASNPDPYRRPDATHPSSLPYEEQVNMKDFLTACLNRFQRHTICTESYCLRKNKRTGQKQCRFNFPRPLQETAATTRDVNPQYWMFTPQRNDALLNPYITPVTMGWLANTDMNPATSCRAVINYIAKYCSKAEKKSESYTDLMRQVLPRLNEHTPLFSLASKLMNKLVGERDWSAQEVCHILLGLPLQQGSRQVVTLDCRPEHSQDAIVTIENDEIAAGRSVLDKYKSRDADIEALCDVTLLDFLRGYNFASKQPRPRALPRIVNYFPRYNSDPSSRDYEDFCRVKMMLHHPFTNVQDLAVEVDGKFSFAAAYKDCERFHTHKRDYLEDEQEDGQEDASEDEFEQPGVIGEDEAVQDWELLAVRGPRNDATRVENPNILGERDLDRSYDWSTHVGIYLDLNDDFWDNSKRNYPADQSVSVSQTAESLQPEQKRVYDAVLQQYERILQGESPPPLRLNVDGPAGTGKSYVIAMISAHLQDRAQIAGKCNPVFRAAPTGVAAFNIKGRTLHSLFRLPVKKAFTSLPPTSLPDVQADFKDCQFLIIDEKSMIGLGALHRVDQRLRQIFPTKQDEWFGGLNVLLLGDFCQLPPVLERALYQTVDNNVSIEYHHGKRAYESFTATVILTQALNQLRNNTVTEQSWKLLLSRTNMEVGTAEVQIFANALRIFTTNRVVDEFNYQQLRDLQVPVISIEARHTGPRGARDASYEEAENLHKVVLLCKGAKIMLTQNIWVERGLVNGSRGVVHDIVWPAEADVSKELPKALLVKFEGYNGPALFTDDADGRPVVPIFPVRRDFERSGATCSRQQLPVSLSYAITVHKSQGLTLDRTVLDLSESEFAAGQTYVAISRVKKLSGLLFETPFDFERFTPKRSAVSAMREEDMRRRMGQQILT